MNIGLRTALDGPAHIVHRHIVKQDGFAAMGQCQFQLRQRAHFHFNDLRAAAVVHGALQSGNDAACEGDVIILDEYPVR